MKFLLFIVSRTFKLSALIKTTLMVWQDKINKTMKMWYCIY
jgi:hypothetical protein